MLVGNNGTKVGSSGNAQSFQANIVDKNGMQFVSGSSLPKTTKNNISKFYTNSGHMGGIAGQDINSGFLNALSTP